MTTEPLETSYGTAPKHRQHSNDYSPKKEDGGLGLIDIRSRNKVIDLMWAKKYLTFENSCPTWAFIADDLILRNAPKNQGSINVEVTHNSFLQTWKHTTHPSSKLQPDS